MSNKKYYLGERINPQLSKSYWKKYGALNKAEAKKKEKCSYGSMYLSEFETEEAYLNKIAELENKNERFV